MNDELVARLIGYVSGQEDHVSFLQLNQWFDSQVSDNLPGENFYLIPSTAPHTRIFLWRLDARLWDALLIAERSQQIFAEKSDPLCYDGGAPQLPIYDDNDEDEEVEVAEISWLPLTFHHKKTLNHFPLVFE